MKKININDFKEELFYEKLSNGLEVFLMPLSNKKNYYISFNVKYGNSYQDFKVDNKEYHVPSGVAHFLEHKLFERDDVVHPFEFFSKSGTDVNAATSIYYTSYYCSGNNKFIENLKYLLNWITKVDITDEKVEKEKGIILQESRMHSDNPARLIYEKLKANTFIKDNYGKKVIGEEEDILKITKEDLIISYNSFYRPDNMFIIVVGDFDQEEIMETIKEELKDFKNPTSKIKKMDMTEQLKVKTERDVINMDISLPRLGIGYKIELGSFEEDRHKLDLVINMILKLLFGNTSSFYEKCLKQDLFVDFNYGVDITFDKIFVSFFAMTNHPEELIKEISQILKSIKFENNDIERAKKVWIANETKLYDNVPVVANTILYDVIFYNKFINNEVELIKQVTLKDISNIAKKLDFNNYTVVKIEPKA